MRQWYLAARTVLDNEGGIAIVYMIEVLLGTMLIVFINLSLIILFGLVA